MLPGLMLVLCVGPLVLQVALVSSASAGLGRLWGGREAEGTTSAVLSATGSGYLLNATASQASTPECSDPCETYAQGVSADSESVCIDKRGGCSLSGCGSMGLCVQRFLDECTDFCSEWGDAGSDSINVCLHKEPKSIGVKPAEQPRPYKCTGEMQCPAKTFRCKQKKIPKCGIYCEGYEFTGEDTTANQDADLLCQNVNSDSEKFGLCMSLPCSMEHHNSINYKKAAVCRQSFPNCPNSCADGSEKPFGETVCFDNTNYVAMPNPNFEKCTNNKACPGDQFRCSPIAHHQNYSQMDASSSAWGLIERSKKSKKAKRVPWSEQWTAQQHVKVAALRRAQGRSLMRSDGAH